MPHKNIPSQAALDASFERYVNTNKDIKKSISKLDRFFGSFDHILKTITTEVKEPNGSS